MIRQLNHDPIALAQVSAPATEEDLPAAQDLLDTLWAHKETCVGMAANMIGVYKCIIAFENDGSYMLMFNPQIVKASDVFEAQESCAKVSSMRNGPLQLPSGIGRPSSFVNSPSDTDLIWPLI